MFIPPRPGIAACLAAKDEEHRCGGPANVDEDALHLQMGANSRHAPPKRSAEPLVVLRRAVERSGA